MRMSMHTDYRATVDIEQSPVGDWMRRARSEVDPKNDIRIITLANTCHAQSDTILCARIEVNQKQSRRYVRNGRRWRLPTSPSLCLEGERETEIELNSLCRLCACAPGSGNGSYQIGKIKFSSFLFEHIMFYTYQMAFESIHFIIISVRTDYSWYCRAFGWIWKYNNERASRIVFYCESHWIQIQLEIWALTSPGIERGMRCLLEAFTCILGTENDFIFLVRSLSMD